MPIPCEVLIGSQIVNGFFTNEVMSDEDKLDWAVRGYLCYGGWLVDYSGLLRAYVQKNSFYGKPSVKGIVIFNYLNLTNKRRESFKI